MPSIAVSSVIDLLKLTRSIQEGHFELSSGLHSNMYFQCARLLQYPRYAEIVAAELIKKIDFDVDVVVGPALGGIIIGYEVAKKLDRKSVFTERKNGIMCLRRGFSVSKDEKVLIVEDVITTAKSAIETANIITELGGTIAGYACIIDRTNSKTTLKISSLIQFSPKIYTPDDCILCKKNIKLDKPGSRN